MAEIPASALGVSGPLAWLGLAPCSLNCALYPFCVENLSPLGISCSPHFLGSAQSGCLPVPAGICLEQSLPIPLSSLNLRLAGEDLDQLDGHMCNLKGLL